MTRKKKVLIISNKIDAHVDLVINRLNAQGIDFVRFNTEDFPNNVEITFDSDSGNINISCLDSGYSINSTEIKSVWYRRPEPPEIDKSIIDNAFRELAYQESTAVLKSLYGSIKALWINRPLSIRRARPKIYQLQVAKELGFNIPRTLVTNVPQKAMEFYESCKKGVIVKTLSTPTIKRNEQDFFTIYTTPVSLKDMKNVNSVRYAPTLFQEYIPKKIELRINIFGDKVFTAAIHSQDNPATKDDWRHYGIGIKYTPYNLPVEIEKSCLKLIKGFGLVFGAIDMILTPDGKYIFLEVNSNGQWIWIEELTGLPLTDALVNLLKKGKL